jgi:hypothetical protein
MRREGLTARWRGRRWNEGEWKVISLIGRWAERGGWEEKEEGRGVLCSLERSARQIAQRRHVRRHVVCDTRRYFLDSSIFDRDIHLGRCRAVPSHMRRLSILPRSTARTFPFPCAWRRIEPQSRARPVCVSSIASCRCI